MKKTVIFLLLLLVLPMTAAAAADVQSMVDALPAVNVLQEMDMDRQRQVYDQTQAAYDAYMALSEEERAELAGAKETFEALFGYFNTLVSPAEAAPAPEAGKDAQLLSTGIAAAAGILLARKIIPRRKWENGK